MTKARRFRTGDFQIGAQEIAAGMQFYCEGHTYEVLKADLTGWNYYTLEVRMDNGRATYQAAAQATFGATRF